MKLKHRLRQSPLLIGLVARMFSGWLRLCHATTRWTVTGRDDLDRCLKDGPILLVLWHEHLMMGLVHWSKTGAPLMSLHDTSPIGRVAAAMEARFGLTPVPMSSKTGNIAMSRLIRRQVSEGVSIGITADGPDGPARITKSAPLDWARATGIPVFVYANGMQRQRRLNTWDRMVFPLPFTRGACVFIRWNADVPRRGTQEEIEALRVSLGSALGAALEQAGSHPAK